MALKDKHRGANAELRAAAWLLEQGFEVFRNVSQHGHIDLVAIDGERIRFFDVKRSYRGGCATPGVEHIFMMADGSCRIMGERERRKPKTRELTPRELVLRKLGGLTA